VIGYLEPLGNINARQAVLWENGVPQKLVDWLQVRGLTVPNFNFVTGTGITPDGNTIFGWGTSASSLFAGFVLKNTQATVVGVVDLGDRDIDAGQPVTFIVDDGSVTETINTTLGENGAYSFRTSLDGLVDISCKGTTWLRKVEAGVNLIAEQSNAGPSFSLLNGDCDGDNSVTIFDYIEISNAFDAVPGDLNWNPNADLDGDGQVSIFDYIILSGNFDLSGDE